MKARTLLLLAAAVAGLLPGIAAAGDRYATCIIRDASGRPHRAVVRVNAQGIVTPRVVRTTKAVRQVSPFVPPVSVPAPKFARTKVYQQGTAYSSGNSYYQPARFPDRTGGNTYLSTGGVYVRPMGHYPLGRTNFGFNNFGYGGYGYGYGYGSTVFPARNYTPVPRTRVAPQSIYIQVPRH